MSYKRISLRFMLEREDHRSAWQALSVQTSGSMNEYIIKAINQFEDRNHIRNIIAEAMLEIIDNHALYQKKEKDTDELTSIDHDAMSFINQL